MSCPIRFTLGELVEVPVGGAFIVGSYEQSTAQLRRGSESVPLCVLGTSTATRRQWWADALRGELLARIRTPAVDADRILGATDEPSHVSLPPGEVLTGH